MNIGKKNCDGIDEQTLKMNREIRVTQFTERSAQIFREQVLQAADEGSDKPIVVYIDSYGGYVDSLAAMLEVLDEVPNPIITVADGKAISCGAILLAHGDFRFCGQYARVMIHRVSSGSWGDVFQMKSATEEGLRINRKFMELLAKNCGKSYEQLEQQIRASDGQELWLNPEEALAFGIIDHIGMPKTVSITQHQIALTPPKARVDRAKIKLANKAILEKGKPAAAADKPAPKTPQPVKKIKKITKKKSDKK